MTITDVFHSNDLKDQENIVKQLNILLVLKVKLVKEGSKRRHRNL